MGTIESHRDLVVWQRGMDLASEVYRLAKLMPKVEEYRLTSQLVKAAASVPANIAEGHSRGTRKDYAHFVSIARGSLAETETFLLLAQRVDFLPAEQAAKSLSLCTELSKMLSTLLARLRHPES